MREFAALLGSREEWLMERVLDYAKKRGYTKYASTLKEAWRVSIQGLTEALLRALPGGLESMELGPEDDYSGDPASLFAVEEARRHRARGISLSMFLGLFKYYRQSYLDVLEECGTDGSGLDDAGRAEASSFAQRFFDRVELGFISEWHSLSESVRLDELREANRLAVNEKNRYLTLFESLFTPVIFISHDGLILNFNAAAAQWLGQALSPGEAYYHAPGRAASGAAVGDPFSGRPATEFLPWLKKPLEWMLRSTVPHLVFEEHLGEGDLSRDIVATFSRSSDVSGKFTGAVLVIQEVTDLMRSQEQLRLANSKLEAEALARAEALDDQRIKAQQMKALYGLSEVLGRRGESLDDMLRQSADAFAFGWRGEDQMSCEIVFDGRAYRGKGFRESAECLARPLLVFGQDRGRVSICREAPGGRPDAPGFQPDEEVLFGSMAGQVEQALEAHLSLTQLARSERQFREFFDNAADAILIHDESGRILDANRNAGIWLGQSTEALAGKNLLDFVAAGDREAAASRFLNALRGEPELFQATLVRRDGFSVPAELLCQSQNYQGRPALIISARNIAGRLRAQAEIERRLELEALAAAVSGRLINTGGEDMTAAMEQSLADLCAFSGMLHAAVYLFEPQRKIFTLAYQWREPDMPVLPERLRRVSRGRMPWLMERITAGERVFIRNANHMPPAARKEKLLLAEAGVASLVAVPMSVEERLLGVLVLASDTPQDATRLSGSALLDQVTLLFANAIERRNAGSALRESESLARAILDALPANICVMNKRGQLTMVNRAWAATGPQSTPLGGQDVRLGLGDNYLEACRRDEGNPFAAQAREGVLAVLSGRTRSFRMEYPGQLAGDQRWFVLQATPLARGKTGAVASHRDITERMRAVKELRESEERFRIIVETAQEGVLRVDTSVAITYANPRTCAMLGYTAEELVGRPLTDVLDPLDHPLLQQKIKRRLQGHSDQYELRFRHKNGHRIWTMMSASPVRGPDGVVVGSIGMVTDISDRVRAEARLRRNEARYRSLVESMHEGLIMTKRTGVVSYVNDRFCAMLGRKRGEFTGRMIVDFADEASRERLDRLLSVRHAEGAEEILWEHGSGRHVYSLVSPSTFVDEEGRVAGFFAVVTDTTERKSLESQLLQSQKLEAIGQLAAGIAHEINTPAQYVGNNVQFIKGAFEDISAVLAATRELTESAKTACPGPEELAALERLMAERDIEYLSGEVPGAIAQTLEGVERISTIVRSVKQFAHPGAAVMAPADLNESMKSTATVSRNEWKYVAELDLDLDAGLPLVVCMIGEINQVVLNLIINAAHAIADAKKIDPRREGRVTLSTKLAPPWAEIRVADTGTGIPESVQARIFDPFFTTKEVGRGTGQGLTISRSIVMDKHKGQLFFETREGEGTTFVVRLPLAPPGGDQ